MIDKAFTADGLAPDGVVLHPRSWVEVITHISDDEDVTTGIQPISVSLRRGSHNKADECHVVLDASAFDFPIRQVGGAEIVVFLGTTEGPTDSIADQKYERFFGMVVDYGTDKEARTASLDAQDLSSLCRKKSFPVRKTQVIDESGNVTRTIDPTPRYSDTLEQAINRLLSILPEFQDSTVEPPIKLRQTDALKGANLAALVTGHATTAPIPLKPDSTVWEAIEHLCGMCGCHVKVSLREIVVRTAEEVFGGRKSKATFIFGGENANAYGPTFHKKPVHNRNGVKVIAMDPETRKPVEAVWPSDSEVRSTLVRKRPAANRTTTTRTQHKKKRKPLPPPARDIYELDPAHYTHAALEAKAKAIWLERSRQECDGSVSTPIWTEEILGLENGDLITIKVDSDVARQIEQIGDDAAAVQMLVDRLGYEKPVADAMVRLARKPSRDDWYAKTITFDHPSERLCTVGVINLLEI